MMSTSLRSTATIKTIRRILLIIGSIIAIDCLVLFALFKFNFGTVVPFLIAIIFLVHAVCWQPIQQLIHRRWQLKRAWQGCWLLFACWLTSFIIFIISILAHIDANTQAFNPQQATTPIDAIIVLGAGTNGDQPSPSLATRLDEAATLWHKYSAQEKPIIITTGGVGLGRTRSESSIMAQYLVTQHQIADNYISLENNSTSTEENLLLSKPLLTNAHTQIGLHDLDAQTINQQIIDKSIAIVTNDFHTVRAQAIAHKQGYQNVYMVASTTPLSIRAHSWFREYFAFMSGWLLDEY